MKVLTDEKLIEKFLNRGVEAIYPTKEKLKKKLMSGERIRVYQGYDPTGPYLHVGHAIGIRALRILQQLGHEVIFLVGDYTAKVGDPDKESARKILTDEEIEKNMSGWKEQAAQIIDFESENPVQFRRNFEWLSKLNLYDIIKLMSHTTVQQMIERDMFNRRLNDNDPIGLQEFIYPLMQGYDSVAMDIDLEIGGTDQTFNMLMGRSIVKAYLNKEKFVRTNKMMDAPDGRTMSKTKGNGINLSDSSEEMYGKAMSYPDSAIVPGLELLTDIPMKDIAEIENDLKTRKTNPMKYKKFMAYEIVKVIKGEDEANKAEEYFNKVFQKGDVESADIPEFKISKTELNIVDLLCETNIAPSRSQARRLIEQGAVKINNIKHEEVDKVVKVYDNTILQVGRQFLKLKR
ncbi:MAG TPA: tyrosine--tRNA ligase [bacterium]|nr:tyrosine--tRNA ligase [bacterium]